VDARDVGARHRSIMPAGTVEPVVDSIFCYGTLLPGEARWHHLRPYVVGEGEPDSTTGRLYDTGLGYPAAVFGGPGTISGRTFRVRDGCGAAALEELDAVEGAVGGLFRRVDIVTSAGAHAWAYEYGAGLELTEIASGSWLAHRTGW